MDDVLGTGYWRNLVVAVNAGPLRAEHGDVLEKGFQRVAARFPTGVGGLFVVGPDSTPTPAAIRYELGEMMKRLGPSLRHVAVVITGSKVWVLMCRTLLAGVSLIWGRPRGFSAHGSVEEACRELMPLLHEPAMIDQASAAVGELVRAIDARLMSRSSAR